MRNIRTELVNKISYNLAKRAGKALALFISVALILALSIVIPGSGISKATDNEEKIVRVGWYESAYCSTDRFGRKTGMAYEYQQKLASYTGWTYEYVEGTWPELLEKLKNGEIDLLSDVSYKEDRVPYMLYPSLPMGTESYYLYVKAGNTEITLDDLSSFTGKTVMVDEGSIQCDILRDWLDENSITMEILENMELSSDESIQKLDDGEIDVYVSMDTYNKSEVCVPVCKIGSSDYYFAVSRDRYDLLQELNHALISIQNEDPFYNQRMYQKYIWSINVSSYLTDAEVRYLSDHGSIRVGYRDNYLPFCTQDEDGVSGALKDYLQHASVCMSNADISFEAVAYKTTEESLEALNNGEIDVVFPVSLSSYDSENEGLFTTDPVMNATIYAVVRSKGADLFEEKYITVALLAGNVNFDNFVKDYFPDWNVIWYPELEQVYSAVARGTADCAMVNGNRINNTDSLRRKYNLSLLSTGEEMGFSFAVKRDEVVLYSILNKCVNRIPETSVDAIVSKYANTDERVSFKDYLEDNIPSVLTALAIVAAVILFLLYLKARSDKKASDRQKLISATELDPLTKLYTRNFFFEYAERLYNDNKERRMDAIVMNIEQFHVVNALYGWNFGDSVLKALGDEISQYIKENKGIACRSQADRFDIYCDAAGNYQQLFERFQDRLDKCAPNISIHLRMGVMPWQKDIEPVQLFDRARTACGMVRGGHHTRVMVFSEEMRERELLDHRLLNDLKRAVENHEFIVYYQPKFNVQADPYKLSSAEALVRWEHPELGMISPGLFISLFEKHSRIGEVDKYVWEETARQIAEWKESYGVTLPVSVNLSRIDIFDPDIVDIIENIVEKHGLKRNEFHLEVTESAYTENEDMVINVVGKFRNLGYNIEMDDFGTGYSSLNMLSHMPIDVLKLDRSFIENIEGSTEDEKDVRLVELILNIAKSLKLVVVAEGVENDVQLNFLKNRGCDIIQGYYFSPPLSPAEFEKKYLSQKISKPH